MATDGLKPGRTPAARPGGFGSPRFGGIEIGRRRAGLAKKAAARGREFGLSQNHPLNKYAARVWGETQPRPAAGGSSAALTRNLPNAATATLLRRASRRVPEIVKSGIWHLKSGNFKPTGFETAKPIDLRAGSEISDARFSMADFKIPKIVANMIDLN